MRRIEDFEKLENLLVTKTYTELTDEEVSWMARYGLSEEGFQQQAKLLRTAKEHLFLSPPSPNIETNTFRTALAERKRLSKNNINRWALSTLLIMISFLLGRWSVGEEQPIVIPTPKATPAEVIVRDTIYLEQTTKEVIVPKLIYRDRVQYDTIYLNLPVAAKTYEEAPFREVMSITTVDELPKLSRNAKETEALLKVLVEVY